MANYANDGMADFKIFSSLRDCYGCLLLLEWSTMQKADDIADFEIFALLHIASRVEYFCGVCCETWCVNFHLCKTKPNPAKAQ